VPIPLQFSHPSTFLSFPNFGWQARDGWRNITEFSSVFLIGTTMEKATQKKK
jgi:hypothetical protein